MGLATHSRWCCIVLAFEGVRVGGWDWMTVGIRGIVTWSDSGQTAHTLRARASATCLTGLQLPIFTPSTNNRPTPALTHLPYVIHSNAAFSEPVTPFLPPWLLMCVRVGTDRQEDAAFCWCVGMQPSMSLVCGCELALTRLSRLVVPPCVLCAGRH
jgi:hypothetical protein